MFFERVLLAFLFSASSLCFSYYWYKKGGPQPTETFKSKEVAMLVSSRNEVQRKPSKRVIWETVGRGEVLYLNEAVRTSSTAEAVIEFTEEGKEGTRIVLEPDSVVVLEETGSDLTLDFLKGNVFVAGGGGEGLKIKSGENTIALGKGELNLAKTETGAVDLQVVSGKASIQANGQSVELGKDESGSLNDGKVKKSKVNLKILQPVTNRRVFVDFAKKEKVEIRWKGLPENYELELLAGPSRNKLSKVEDVQLDYQQSKLLAPFKVGRVYWRLQAKSKENEKDVVKSTVIKNRIVALLPPKILEPEPAEFIVLEATEPTYMFQFANPLATKDMVLQVWPQGQKPTPANTKTTQIKGSSFLYEFAESGRFSAVLTGYLDDDKGEKMALQSKAVQFRVQLGQKLVPPELTEPEPQQRLAFQEVINKGVFMKWKPVPTIKKYQVRVERSVNGKWRAKTSTVSEPVFLIKKVKPGKFRWSVASVDRSGLASEWSERREFSIGNVPTIQWADGRVEGKSYYVGVDPVITLDWDNSMKEVVRWRVKLAEEGEYRNTKKWIKAKDSPYRKKVKLDGFYEARVQGIGESGLVIAQTPIRVVEVLERPLLPAPQFAQNIPDRLKATARGNLQLKWTEVDGATEYLVHLMDEDEQVIDRFREKNISTVLKSLKPGSYRINVRALDQYGREGDEGEVRPVTVDNKSDVRAPAFKKVKVRTFKGGK